MVPAWANEAKENKPERGSIAFISRLSTLGATGGRDDSEKVNTDVVMPVEALVMMNNIRKARPQEGTKGGINTPSELLFSAVRFGE